MSTHQPVGPVTVRSSASDYSVAVLSSYTDIAILWQYGRVRCILRGESRVVRLGPDGRPSHGEGARIDAGRGDSDRRRQRVVTRSSRPSVPHVVPKKIVT